MKYWYSEVKVRKRGKIPHWHVPRGIYFVTYRLVGSLPRPIEQQLVQLREDLVAARLHDFHGETARYVERALFKLAEAELDQNRGACWLRNPEVASLLLSSFEYGDGEAYEIVALAVMPNHVHVVFRLKDDELDHVVQRWKSFTAHKANALLGRTGTFWQDDYFDVLMRDSEQLQRAVQYVMNNPAKARLFEWPYTRIRPDRIASMI